MSGEEFISQIKKAKKIALCVDELTEMDHVYFVVALDKLAKQLDTKIDLIHLNEIRPEFKKKLEENSVSFASDPKPLSYVISIDYSKTGIEKITYDPDEKEGKLKFFIIPTDGQFDFDNVEYSTEGSNYDLTMTMKITSFKDMGRVYEKNGYIFKDNKVISFAQGIDSLGDMFIGVDESGYSVKLYELVKDTADQEVLSTIVTGVIEESAIAEGGANFNVWMLLGDAAGRNINVNNLMQKAYYQKDPSLLDVYRKQMFNVENDDDNRVVWSILDSNDLGELTVSQTQELLKGRLIFNVSSQYDIAFAVYEFTKDRLSVVVESNATEKYSAEKIAKVFGGDGTAAHAQFVVEDMPPSQFKDRFAKVVEDLYQIRFGAKRIEAVPQVQG
ncbi:MAG: hypothetical protein QY318_02690 [Candidatus Dojkabacteria bacterium]|nr:MAG: hypothetical protein QY318_02690 [Candidatus Dojkabacteria bacterium]